MSDDYVIGAVRGLSFHESSLFKPALSNQTIDNSLADTYLTGEQRGIDVTSQGARQRWR